MTTAVEHALAIDVGGTTIKSLVLDRDGIVAHSDTRPTPVADGAAAVVDAMRAAARAAQDSVPSIVTAGVAVPGAVDSAAGIGRYSANLGWRDIAVRDLLGGDLGVPVAVEHDVRAAGIAERAIGAARGVPNCLIVVIGTGIAAVVVADGAPMTGDSGLAGEIGHLAVVPDGDECACGQRGCLEVYSSAAAIARRYRALTGSTVGTVAAADVAARLGADAAADDVWAVATTQLGIALAAATMLLDPGLIVLGGGLAEAGTALAEPVRAALTERIRWRPVPRLEISPLGARAGVLGAALVAWRAAGVTGFEHWPLASDGAR